MAHLNFSTFLIEENYRLNQDSDSDNRKQTTIIQQTNRIWRFQCWLIVGTLLDLVIYISLQGNDSMGEIEIFALAHSNGICSQAKLHEKYI